MFLFETKIHERLVWVGIHYNDNYNCYSDTINTLKLEKKNIFHDNYNLVYRVTMLGLVWKVWLYTTTHWKRNQLIKITMTINYSAFHIRDCTRSPSLFAFIYLPTRYHWSQNRQETVLVPFPEGNAPARSTQEPLRSYVSCIFCEPWKQFIMTQK